MTTQTPAQTPAQTPTIQTPPGDKTAQSAPATSQGYLAAIAGGAAGALALAAAGVAVGAALIPILEDPNGGMGNLGLILIPLALGAIGIVAGMWLGVWATLKRTHHHGAAATASLTIPLTVFGMFTTTGYFPVGVPVLLFGVPALARHIVVKGGGQPAAYPVTIDSSRDTTSEIGGRDAAWSAIEREA